VQPLRKLTAKALIAIGCRTQPMIEVRESGERELSVFREVTQQNNSATESDPPKSPTSTRLPAGHNT
jgi:hypothetical protein